MDLRLVYSTAYISILMLKNFVAVHLRKSSCMSKKLKLDVRTVMVLTSVHVSKVFDLKVNPFGINFVLRKYRLLILVHHL